MRIGVCHDQSGHVEDRHCRRSRVFRAGLEQVLGSLGFAVVASVGDGDAALAAVKEHHPDLVILDVRMPVRDGVEVLKALRAKGDATPILILAAEIDDDRLVSAVRAGVNGIVFKDTEAGALREAIGTVMAGNVLLPYR
jgi:two-component system nitrate/nitrite response regulator NarP